jgi:glycosyltransferase involved in cell wall biosynthesis
VATESRLLKNAFLEWLFNKVSGFLCIGSLNREFYRSRGVAQEKLFSMPYAVDNGWFQQQCERAHARREEFRRELGLSHGRPIILFAGKFIPIKAPLDLIAAFQLVVSESIAARPYLLFAGDGPLRKQMETTAGDLAGKDIRFVGFQNQTQLPAFYDLCDVFVLPSLFEPWGLVINEVMNAGRPVIVSNQVGAAPDLVHQGENGWIYPAGDVRALAGCIRQAIMNRDSTRMGEKSLQLIGGWNFDADIVGLKQALKFVTDRNSCPA